MGNIIYWKRPVEVTSVKLGEYILLAFSEILHNKARTFLTLIGIIIGIAAVILIIFVVQGAETYLMSEIQRVVPVDIIQIYPRWDSDTQRVMANISMEDINIIKDKIGNKIRALAPRYTQTGELRYHGKEYDCELIPTTPSFQDIYELKLDKGRFLTPLDIEEFNQVIVLGYETAETLFNKENAIGKKVTLFGVTFNVIGVLPEDYQSPIVTARTNDTRGFIPISVLERFAGIENRFSLVIRGKSSVNMQLLQKQITEILNIRYGVTDQGEPKFHIFNMGDGLEMIGIIKIVLMVLLSGVASITLLVAGIGVMNIMLVIITERTKEIGLRKALGATRRDIMLQFIIESITLCLVGGLTGTLLGYWGSNFALDFANNYIEVNAGVPVWAVLVSLGFTTAVGLFFGIYPAFKASRLDPIEALRYE